MDNWNKQGFFSGITEDYSNYRWFKGEKANPYINDDSHPLASRFWEYERDFHYSFLEKRDFNIDLKAAYLDWKKGFIEDYLPGKSPNPYGDTTDWHKAFENGYKA